MQPASIMQSYNTTRWNGESVLIETIVPNILILKDTK